MRTTTTSACRSVGRKFIGANFHKGNGIHVDFLLCGATTDLQCSVGKNQFRTISQVRGRNDSKVSGKTP